MRRLVTLLIAASMLALPSHALAQSAGDEQYADPFGQVEEPTGGQGQAPDQSAPAPAAPAQTAPSTGDQAVASQQTAAPTLPRTGPGLPAWYLAINGAVLLLAGTAVRRRFS